MHDVKLEILSQTMPFAARRIISVIVPERNGGANLQECLAGLIKATPSSAELIVVADGDADGSWRVAKEFRAKVLKIPESQGPARARNLGAQNAQGDILFFVDADVVIPPDALSQI
jgi:glycosyltransferase involved in cell wall biosynthesis